VGGGKIARGGLIGKTNEHGTAVVDKQVNHANLFHTYLSALDLDPTGHFEVAGREMPMADPAFGKIAELLT
jgi:hypothetical protein